jgi:hypothetical protein
MLTVEARSQILANYGATPEEIQELLSYNANVFDPISQDQAFPLAPEPHVSAWQDYLAEAETIGVFAALQRALVQLQFPIQAGMSQTASYGAATRKGRSTQGMPEATGLQLEQPEDLQLVIHPSLAGAIPVLITGCRADFESLIQAFTKRNEPEPIPAAMGAAIIGGYNNWDRVNRYRANWESTQSQPVTEAAWQAEFKRLIPQKSLYQDRFIILSRGTYSAIAASDLGLSESAWLDLSLTIRLEHECTHYFTRRVFGSMRNNLIDEVIADYQGITAATGGMYHATWFLRFMGLENFPDYRPEGRLKTYRGDPPLSDGAFTVLRMLVKDVAENLAAFNHRHQPELANVSDRTRFLIGLSRFTIEALADRQTDWLETLWSQETTQQLQTV